MKVLIGTKNAGKIEGAKQAFLKYNEDIQIEGIAVPSEVNDQPVNEETCKGIQNRVKNLKGYAKEKGIEADYYIAIESGITNQLGKWFIINMALIEDKSGYQSYGSSAGFPVPESLVEEIIQKDLSQVINQIFGSDEERHNKNGGIQLLTKDQMTRIDLTREAFLMALIPHINDGLWK